MSNTRRIDMRLKFMLVSLITISNTTALADRKSASEIPGSFGAVSRLLIKTPHLLEFTTASLFK